MLVETHSWKDYRTRVRITRNVILETLSATAEHAQAWLGFAKAADQRAAQLAGKVVPLRYDNDDHSVSIEFRGYAYTRKPSAFSGGIVTHYDDTKPQIWHVPLLDRVKPVLSVAAPRGGYVVPAAHAAWVRAKLELHGIQFVAIAHALPARCSSRIVVRSDRAAQSCIADGVARAASARFACQLGFLQRCVRAQRVHGRLRGG
jgi:hypothetical protein